MIPWTAAHQAPVSMRFSSQGYWSVLPFPSPGNLPNPGIEPRSPILQADSLLSEPPGKPYNFQYVNAMFFEKLNHTNIVTYYPRRKHCHEFDLLIFILPGLYKVSNMYHRIVYRVYSHKWLSQDWYHSVTWFHSNIS